MTEYGIQLLNSHSNAAISPIDMLRLVRPHQSLQSKPRRIDRALARVNKHIIQKPTKSASDKRRHDGDPEIVVARTPHLGPVANSIAHQPRAKVSGKVHRVAGLEAETRAKAPDQEEEANRENERVSHSAGVGHVHQGEDDEHEDRGLDCLGPELSIRRHEWLRVGTEDASGGGLAWGNGPDAGPFEVVDGVVVVAVDDAGGEEAAEELRKGVERPALPG